MIVSVHLPKTAGTSFATALEQIFGESLYRDYADLPLNTPHYKRNRAALKKSLANARKNFRKVECIHGHFLPLKYLLLSDKRDITFVTWMREPVERALSHYHFWKRSPNPKKLPPLRRRMIEEKWSLERFCLGPELRDIYTQFLFGFKLDYFSFIGITEFYSEDLSFFSKHFLNSSLEPERLNVGSAAGNAYQISGSLRSEIEQFHSRDMELYERALEKRQKRSSR